MESKSGNLPIISPKTKIGELLEAWPQLEDVLIEMSPVFEKLRNPILRRTVARVATIQQVSVVGGIPVEDIVNRLRAETGQMAETNVNEAVTDTHEEQPSWFNEEKITTRYDSTPVINAGESPMTEVLARANELISGEILELQSPFIPAPVLDILQRKNFKTWSVQKGNIFFNYILKP
jgi:hypothetical protein